MRRTATTSLCLSPGVGLRLSEKRLAASLRLSVGVLLRYRMELELDLPLPPLLLILQGAWPIEKKKIETPSTT